MNENEKCKNRKTRKTENCFLFFKSNKIDKPLTRLNKGIKKTQTTDTGNETVYITISPAPVRRIRDFQEQVYFHIFHILDVMDQFLKIYKLP